MKYRHNLIGVIFAVLFFILAMTQFYKNDYIDGVFYIVAVIGFLVLYFASNYKKSN